MATSQPQQQRAALRDRLIDEGEHALAAVLTRCAQPFNLVCTNCGTTKQVEQGCKKRWCPVCAGKISAMRCAIYERAARAMQWPLAVTLTQPGDPSANGCVRSHRKAITDFRRRNIITDTVRGGIIGIEVTNSRATWHVHSHWLIDCRWLALRTRQPRSADTRATVRKLCTAAHEELSAAWATSLGIPQAVVWVERAWGKAVMETVKYAVKPAELIACKRPIGNLLREMHRQQLVNGFGSCYGQVGAWKKEMRAARPVCECDECHQRGTIVPEAALPRGAARESMQHTHGLRHNVCFTSRAS